MHSANSGGYRFNPGSSPASQRKSTQVDRSTSTGAQPKSTGEPRTSEKSLAQTVEPEDEAFREKSETSETYSGGEIGPELRAAYEHGSLRDVLLATLEQERRNGGKPEIRQQADATDPSPSRKERRKQEKLVDRAARKNEKAREKANADNVKIREKKRKALHKEAKASEKQQKELKKAAEKAKAQEDESRRKQVAERNRRQADAPFSFHGDIVRPRTKEEKKAAQKLEFEKSDD